MKRYLGFLVSVVIALILAWGCSKPVSGVGGCDEGSTDCNGQCVFLDGDAANCGACGNACAPGSSCNSGSCGCQAGSKSCQNQCVNVNTDNQNCGNCGVACGFGQSCSNGSCQCSAGLQNCSGACVNTTTDAAHCGTCTTACSGATPFCSSGVCSATCGGGQTQCGQSCVNVASDISHCGNCATACAAGQACNNGSCGCGAGQGPCGVNGACVDTTANPNHCGACGNACTGGRTCTGSTCACASGQEFCASTSSCVPAGSCTTGAGGSGAGGNSSTGGSPSTGGSGNTTSTGGSGPLGTPPPGWWTAGTWHGCTWTGIDVVANSTTTNMPRDFLTTSSAPYCVSGTVNATYESVALLGFNLNETPNGSATQCAYKPADPTAVGPTGVALTGTGIALSFSKSVASNLRIQIQGPNGGMAGTIGENDRWCYTITEVQGPIFAPFSKFNTRCFDNSGTAYAGQPISAVSFLVPGLPVASPFSYCIGGFATGPSVTAAPAYTPTPAPVVAGTIGGNGPTVDLDFQRVKVNPAGSTKQYIIQNNNWGTPMGTDQTITYRGNSFNIVSTTGNVTGAGVPASFPSIFIGGNGDTQSANDPPKGVFSTHPGDNLPKQISTIGTAMTTMTYNRASGDYNATYDIWVAAGAPTSAYNDALSGFVMVWLYQPSGRSPIGTKVGTATLGTPPNTYDVWVGPRNSGTNPNRPVVSYVANPNGVLSRTFDLKPILIDAASHGIPSNWFVTDVFGGFEIWTGSSAAGLQMTNFTVDMN